MVIAIKTSLERLICVLVPFCNSLSSFVVANSLAYSQAVRFPQLGNNLHSLCKLMNISSYFFHLKWTRSVCVKSVVSSAQKFSF
jgi:hypothetical protein